MRLQQFITEKKEYYDDNIVLLNNLIKKDCKQYLKILGNLPGLYRGMDAHKNLGKNQTRADRTPRGMSSDEQEYINKLLQKNGHNIRSGVVFTSGDIDEISIFGKPYYIFPIGNISYTWIETIDINMSSIVYTTKILEFLSLTKNSNIDELKHFIDFYGYSISKFFEHGTISEVYDEYKLHNDKMYKDIRKRVEKKFIKMFHTDKGFRKAWTNSYEIWIKCKEYYFANAEKYVWSTKAKKLFRKADTV